MKSFSKINIVAALTLAIATVSTATSQDLTSYFVTGSIERSTHNASFAPDRGYFNIPLVGNTSFSMNGNISLDNMLYNVDGSLVPLLDTRVSATDALSGLNTNNNLALSNRLTILGFGGYGKNRTTFWDFSLNLRTSASLSLPYSLFEFMKTAPEYSQIRDINIYAESYAEMAFGYSRVITDKLTVGARVKLLAGLMNASLNIDKMDVALSADEWMVDAQGTLDLNINGVTTNSEYNDNGQEVYDLGDFDFNPTKPAGYGFAVDLGATYQMTDRLTLSLGVNDIGMINWAQENNTSATVAKSFSFAGADVDLSTGETTNSTDEINFDDIDFVANESVGGSKWLQGNLNAGAEYNFLNNKIGVGAVYSARFWRSGTVHNVTTVGTLRPVKWFSFAASYGLINNQTNALGLAANFSSGFLNLYVATDILMSKMSAQYIPIEQSNMNFSFGMALSFGKGQRN